MPLFVDLKFVGLIGSQVRNFKKKQDYLWNFSCPLCGDSKKNKLKARGFLYRSKENLRYKCHNCSCNIGFSDLLKHLDPEMHKQYLYDSFLEDKGIERKEPEKKKPEYKPKKEFRPAKPTVLAGCPSITTLGEDHPAKKYILGRKLPEMFLKQLFWCDDFAALVKKISPPQAENLRKNDGRIIIPFLDTKYQLLAIQGRTLDPQGIRYITIKAYEEAPRIYGMHRLGKVWKRIYIVEGPFDSMFLPNCLAMAGSDIPQSLPIDKVLVAYDNEPRKKETCDKLGKAIEKGYRVCIWPDTVTEKDINDMVLQGYSPEKIRTLIDRNSYSGLEAKFRLQQWRKD